MGNQCQHEYAVDGTNEYYCIRCLHHKDLCEALDRIAALEKVAEAALIYFGAHNTVGISADIVRKPLRAAGYLKE